jgi:DNA-directed RNA polymerase specialized sigma24 family protein
VISIQVVACHHEAPMMEDCAPDRFPTTHWSRVLAAGERSAPEARQALADMCTAYWYPLYVFIRRKGHGPEEALDLTQDYFARLVERRIVAAANPVKGRFRSFLLADCTHFLAHRRDHDRALRRGGAVALVSIDTCDAEGRYLREPAHNLTPERLFERDWAVALLAAVVARLRQEYHDSGRDATFEVLKVTLSESPRAISQAELAARLGISPGAVQVAIHRLRKRYRAMVREAIAATTADEVDPESEISELFAALGS